MAACWGWMIWSEAPCISQTLMWSVWTVLSSAVCYNALSVSFQTLPPSLTPSWCRRSLSVLDMSPSCCWRVSSLLSVFLLPLCVCVCDAFGKEYVTVGQLNQMYGMPKVESSPTSPLRQPLQSGAADPAFSCLPSPHGSSLSLSVEVCPVSTFLSSFPPSCLATFVNWLWAVQPKTCCF